MLIGTARFNQRQPARIVVVALGLDLRISNARLMVIKQLRELAANISRSVGPTDTP